MALVGSISQQIWDMKYRLRSASGEVVDKTIEDTWRRVAAALAAPERDAAQWTERFYAALTDFKFLPAGRVVAGAGSARSVTLFNCFVMGAIPDDMGGIFAHLREAALTMQQGGGIGYDFSTLRPKGARSKASAPTPRGRSASWMCGTPCAARSCRAGYRRGAMMATLRCDHPDIEAFIEAKREPERLRMFNLSVLVTDAFHAGVEENGPGSSSFGGQVEPRRKSCRARAVGQAHAGDLRLRRAGRHLHRPHQRAQQPPLLRGNPATNPCGEQPLPPYGACLLGSINLARLIEHPFTRRAARSRPARGARESPCASSTMSSTSRNSRSSRSARRRWPSAASASASPGLPMR